jgi:hypothetical protein
MTKLMVLIGTTVGSALGWWIGSFVGIMTAFMISMVGFGVGMWGGARLARRWTP